MRFGRKRYEKTRQLTFLKVSKPRLFLAVGIVWVLMGVVASCGRRESASKQEPSEGVVLASTDWKNPDSCRLCHEQIFADWQGSHHALANRELNPQIDAEAFESGVVIDAAGQSYLMRRNGDSFFIDTVYSGPGGGSSEAKVVAVIGETPLRQFLVEAGGGRLQAHSMAWDVELKEWFNVFGDEGRVPGEWGHWSGQGMNWNANCASCHMTEYQKNFDDISNAYSSEWTHQGITCIECHGDFESHAVEAAQPNYASDPERTKSRVMDNCARCHSRREELTANRFRPGDSFDQHYRLALPGQPGAYFESGQSREEIYVYGSLMSSHMGAKGVTCLDCHDPHTSRTILPVENNALCMRCHETGYMNATAIDQATHSGHAAGSEGAQCVVCHMPERTFMGRDIRRDHGFTIPDPRLTRAYATPNACMDCHAEEGFDWIAEGWHEIFSVTPRVENARERAALLYGYEIGEPDVEATLIRLHSEQNVYWQAALLRLLAQLPVSEHILIAARAFVESDDAIVRDAALSILAESDIDGEAVLDSLSDENRMVRLRAAGASLARFDESNPAFAEWQDYVEFNSDWPSVSLQRALIDAQSGDVASLDRRIRQAVNLDRNNALVRYDAAVLLDRAGETEKAIIHMKVASALEPSSPVFAHGLGLLYGAVEDYASAIRAMSKAVALDPGQDRWWYNLAILQVRNGDSAAGVESLKNALELAPHELSYQQFMQQLSQRAESN